MKYNLPNWCGGARLSSGKFVQMENHFIEALSDCRSVALNDFNYGLLPYTNSKEQGIKIEISQRITNNLHVELKFCNAVTREGIRLFYDAATADELNCTYSFSGADDDSQNSVWYLNVVLAVDPFSHIPSGIPDIKQSPLHYPDVVPSYKLFVVPEKELISQRFSAYFMVIGRIRRTRGRCEIDAGFIPPCTSMASHSKLLKYHGDFCSLIDNIEYCSVVIIQKIVNSPNRNTISLNVLTLCRNILSDISRIQFSFKNTGACWMPVQVVDCFSTLAHVIYLILQCMDKREKEELLNYFYEWDDIKPGAFESLLKDMINIVYNPDSIHQLMIQANEFLMILSELWSKMATVEFLGQHKESIIVSDREAVASVKKKKIWSY